MFDFHWPWMVLLLALPAVMWLGSHRHAWRANEKRLRQMTLLHPGLQHLQDAFETRKLTVSTGSIIYYLLLAVLWGG